MVNHAVASTAASLRRETQDDLRDRARLLASMLRRLTGALREADLDRKVSATTDPQATLADQYRLPMSRPRTARVEVTLNLKVAEQHLRAALAAVGVQWIDEV